MGQVRRRGFLGMVVGAAGATLFGQLPDAAVASPTPDVQAGGKAEAQTAARAADKALSTWEKLTGMVFVDGYGDAEDGDSTRVQAAVNDAVRRGLGGVVFAARTYDITVPIVIPPVAGFAMQGVRGSTVITRRTTGQTSTAFRIRGKKGDKHSGIHFAGLTFVGGMRNIDELGTRRARGKYNGQSISTGDAEVFWNDGVLRTAISIDGNLTHLVAAGVKKPNEFGRVRDVTITDCDFLGMPSLPVFLRGIAGQALLTGCLLRRSLDPGWIFCESAQFIGNRSEYSMDNGVSLSRECDQVVAADNTIVGAWFSGVSVAGFAPESSLVPLPPPAAGPRRATVTGNVIEMSGKHGITAHLSGGELTISGNTIMSTLTTSKTDALDGVGILVSEWTAGDMPRSVTISGNTIDEASRGGILVRNARSATITGNTVRNVGVANAPDGSRRDGTAGVHLFGIGSGDGAALDAGSTMLVVGNSIVDHRGTKACTHHPVHFRGGVRLVQNNLAFGTAAALTSA